MVTILVLVILQTPIQLAHLVVLVFQRILGCKMHKFTRHSSSMVSSRLMLVCSSSSTCSSRLLVAFSSNSSSSNMSRKLRLLLSRVLVL